MIWDPANVFALTPRQSGACVSYYKIDSHVDDLW